MKNQDIIAFNENTKFKAVYHWKEVIGKVELQEEEYRIYDFHGTIKTVPYYRDFGNGCYIGSVYLKEVRITTQGQEVVDKSEPVEGGPTKVSEGYCLWEIAYKDIKVKKEIHGEKCTFTCIGKENGDDENTVIIHLSDSNERGIITNFKELMKEKAYLEYSLKEEKDRKIKEAIEKENEAEKRRNNMRKIKRLQEEYKNFSFLKKLIGGENLKRLHHVSENSNEKVS